MTLKRWTRPGEDGNEYDLCSLATHVGPRPDSGHYIAYRRDDFGFLKMDDERVSRVQQRDEDYFVTTPTEKVYVLFYIKREINTEARPAKFARLASAASIDLDEEVPACVTDRLDLDEDSDVLAQPDSTSDRKASCDGINTPSTDGRNLQESATADVGTNPPRANQPRKPLLRFSEAERLKIQATLQGCSTVKQATTALAVAVPKLTIKDKKAPGYLSGATLRNWVQNPSSFDKAMAAASRERPQARGRASAVGSTRASLSPEDKAVIAEALEKTTSTSDPLPGGSLERLQYHRDLSRQLHFAGHPSHMEDPSFPRPLV